MKLSALVKGSILSETSFFTVEEVKKNSIMVKDDHGNNIEIGKEYVETVLASADQYEFEESKTITELAELFINSPRIAITVCFRKKDTEKTKKAFNQEKQTKIDQIRNAKVSEVEGLLSDLIENPITKIIPGELRVMKGRHYGAIDDMGRIQFVDMELPLTDPSSRLRQVDPRTIRYLIVGGVKYNLKK